MSSILGSQGVFLATAMAAVSGTVIILALRLQKSILNTSSSTQFQVNPIPILRPCLSSGNLNYSNPLFYSVFFFELKKKQNSEEKLKMGI